MKRLFSVILLVAMLATLGACGGGGSSAPSASSPSASAPSSSTPSSPATSTPAAQASPAGEPFPGKIAIITNTVSQNEEEYRSAQMMVEKYDASKIVHETWPDNFMQEQEQMISIVARLGSDPDIKAIIINQAVPGCNPAIDKLKETRDDIFIVYCTPQEDPPAVAERANIIIMPDELSMGPVMVAQAAALGAKTFVHYSFPRHMSQPLLSGRRNLIRENCEALGLKFVDATAPDPTGESGLPGAQQFILEDVPKMVAEYGKDTAFFSTNCSMQIPLITKVVDEGAIYPQPCCPSPYHGFPTALGIESPDGTMGTVDYIVAETTKKLDAAGVLGRLSTWPVPAAMMSTVASTEYAVKWINGEVQKDGVDMAALAQCMKEYAGVDIDLETYDNIDNFIVFLMGYLTYGV